MLTAKITGANNLERIARELKATGDKELRRELLRGIQKGAKPLKEAVKRSADLTLPQRGGLHKVVARSKVSVRTRLAGGNPGVTLRADSGHDINAMDRGRLRHPVFGDRRAWVTQQIKPGWWSLPIKAAAPAVRQNIEQAMESVIKKIK